EFVAEIENVFNALDTLALTELRDMDQAVTPGEDVDERPELGDVDDLAGIDRADFGLGRIEDELDAPARFVDGIAVARPNGDGADGAVVVDVDVGARLLLQGVDDLALGADDLADLVERDREADDARRSASHLCPRLGDGLGHDVENLESRFARLLQRLR